MECKSSQDFDQCDNFKEAYSHNFESNLNNIDRTEVNKVLAVLNSNSNSNNMSAAELEVSASS